MHASGWIRLLRRIPADQIDKLSLTTTNGTELSIQSVVRVEEEFLLIRARIAGSSEAGRAFFIPYDQINLLGFLKPMKEDQLRALFGGPDAVATLPPQASAEPAPPLAEAQPPPSEPVPPAEGPSAPPSVPPPNGEPGPTSPSKARTALPSKSRVLANLRARLKHGPSS